jgi:hypothetical protein
MRVVVIALAVWAATARAETKLCLDVRADSDTAGLRKLAEAELGHHPTHHLVVEDCASHLSIELFSAAGARYLTLRINQEVPVRFTVKTPHEIEEKLSEGLRQVLQHDPVYLSEDLSQMNTVWRTGANLVRRGTNRYRVEVFEVIGNGGNNAVFASGAAFTVARGIDHLQVFARLDAAGSASGLGADSVTLRVLAGGDLGVLYEVSARANSTFYIGPALALHYLRFEGKTGNTEAAPVDSLLFSIALRTGVRLLRFYDVDVDLFAQLHLPFYPTSDPDSKLIDAYTPYMMAGLGVGF